MRKFLKVFLLSLFTFIILTFSKNVYAANSISKISMDIYLDNNGNAQITETWNCKASQGTEVYHPYYNLGNSEIQNLSVSEGTTSYETLSSWNTSGTLSSKAYKCGLNQISNGVEICWGISEYGKHTYTVKYTITNFVSNLTDSQMIYWTLIPYDFSTSIGQVYIKIYSSFDFSDDIPVWGYGNYGGTAYVYDGYIEMQSDGTLSTDEYMTILVQFPSGTFNCSNSLNHDFDYYYDMSQEGSVKYEYEYEDDYEYSSSSSGIGSFINVTFFFILNIIFIFLPFVLIFSVASSKSSSSQFDYGSSGKSIPKDVDYFRDIPYGKDLFRDYFIAYKYDILKKKTDILGAIILKWLKDSLIRIEQKETGIIFKKENVVIVLNETSPDSILNHRERELFKMLYEASKDGYLENKEFEKWCNKSYSRILSWFDRILDEEKQKLVDDGLITLEEKTTLKIFKSKTYTATPALKQKALELAGLKRFLEDYSLIAEREAIEVHLFEEYLIYAQMMGIAQKVAAQFKELYPEILEASSFYSYDNIMFINMCAHRGITKANSAKSRAEARANSYSSGGGGFSSGGGGGGSFGGGGGGGGFR